jgi:hypothetical protein
MTRDQAKRMAPSAIASDRESLAGLKTITNYAPANPAYSVAAMGTAETAMLAAQETETQAVAALATARDNAADAEWNYHNLVLGMKDQVVALFGRDSNQAQSIGLKKKSEYKPRGRKGQK